MQAQTATKRSWSRWALGQKDNIKFWIHLIGWFLVVLIANSAMIALATPAISTRTTSHPMPYLPTNFEVVENVTNVFKEEMRFGGAGGIGSPQVEMSMQAYRENERKDTTHFLVISPGEKTVVDFYDLHPGKVVHTNIEQDSPTWGRWGLLLGSYRAKEGTLRDGELVLERVFFPNGTILVLALLASVVATAIYAAAIRPLNWLIINRIFNRLASSIQE